MGNDKWLMFKNYMHNELDVAKEDIRDWLVEAIKEEAKALVNQEHGKFSVKAEIDRYLIDRNYWGSETLKKEVIDAVADRIAKNIKLSIV